MSFSLKKLFALAVVASTISNSVSSDPNFDNLTGVQTEASGFSGPSLLSRRPDLRRCNFLMLNTTNDTDGSHLTLSSPTAGEITSMVLSKDKNAPDRGKWDELVVVKLTKRIAPNLVLKKKFNGSRKHFLSSVLAGLLCGAPKYDGTIFDYKNFPAWYLKFQDVDEVREAIPVLLSYLAQRKSFEKKPVLLLELASAPFAKLENILPEDVLNQLKVIFEIANPEDIETIVHFTTMQRQANERIIVFEQGKTIRVGETLNERLLRGVEGWIEDGDSKEITPKFIGWLFAAATGFLAQKAIGLAWEKLTS